jgi:predicted ArsR family transcriptional regulator
MTYNLFTYPLAAGAKDQTTSRDAAQAIEQSGRAMTLRERVEGYFLAGRRATADEVAHALNETILAIRPRITELFKLGKIERTGAKRRSDGGRPGHEYRRKVG